MQAQWSNNSHKSKHNIQANTVKIIILVSEMYDKTLEKHQVESTTRVAQYWEGMS